ncbi:MAG: methionine--tRNA ligase [Deltaproteobacteria bacterium CG11_big_fil_rev_8_21_14_0_20_47_16]|nr:MAG: methionine--tRNA ligase [Deltaproteobacteria bacterium CG11_big_fil_rev_8_21_14_0_20_47_16]
MKKKIYITTAIDYVNSTPHIGTAYEKIGADALARFYKLDGHDVRLQMGNDEHSTNVRKAAEAKGLDPQKYCDEMEIKFKSAWDKLGIDYDDFVRTTNPTHKAGVQKLFQTLFDKGDVYKGTYKGWYCDGCEAYYLDKDLVDGVCPHHKSKPKWVEQVNYFFKLSKYQDWLKNHIQTIPEFILPVIRKNEIMKVVEGGLIDVSVSREGESWGVPVPFDPTHSVYVWFDALINYITGIGYGTDAKKFKTWWDDARVVHVIGKDITRFHCVIWPCMLHAAGIKVPDSIFGHGFVYTRGERMSKTLGNVVDPLDVVNQFGPDPLRYYLLRTSSFGSDGDFTWDAFIERYNSDLANGIGNLVARTVGMLHQYCNGEIPENHGPRDILRSDPIGEIVRIPSVVRRSLDCSMNDDILFHVALQIIWDGIAKLDQFITEKKPWRLAKEGNQESVRDVLHEVCEGIFKIAIMISPFMPATAEKIWSQMGFDTIIKLKDTRISDAENAHHHIIQPVRVKEAAVIFPRIEKPKEEPKPKEPKKDKKMEQSNAATTTTDGLISIDDFAKIELRVAEITSAEKVEGADKLLKLQVSLGDSTRQIVAGIAKHYDPATLVGKKIVVVANLKPAKLRGVESQGMLLAASDDTGLCLVDPGSISVGGKVK